MKLAIAAQNGQVFQHFGKCPAFAVYTIENNTVQSSEILDATGSGHAAMAGLLTKNGIEVVICGGIGESRQTNADRSGAPGNFRRFGRCGSGRAGIFVRHFER